jgi:hypothetical protein
VKFFIRNPNTMLLNPASVKSAQGSLEGVDDVTVTCVPQNRMAFLE